MMNFNPRSIPPATRYLLLASVFLFLVGLLLPPEYLALIPGSSVFWVWTFLTAGFWEGNIIALLINGAGLLLGGKYFEHAWGSREFLKYVLIVNTGAYAGVFFATVVEYAVTMNSSWLFESQASGLAALLAGFIVSFKQAVPEHSIKLFNAISIRAKYLPSIYVLVNFVLFVVRIIHVHFFVVLFGTLVSWTYSRFYKRHEGMRGDRSETFSFASFWPDFMQPFIKPLSNTIFKLFVSLKLCSPIGPQLPTTVFDGEGGSKVAPLPGTEAADAERRRALALRALDMRLAETVTSPTAGASGGTNTPNRAVSPSPAPASPSNP
ncbi:uncharacterized protein SPPG_04658 [Spizellomyces punctatus DAOM BR117]|uniref:Peptidase S54 rhomboid domain-containing protein n=1 Tax=Spizellomyces punctatus (strain DAOM BR117) TaxID=645134 RepID=A0A0L0HFS2_SPIPD|nr:uncharacterized protein SPPG_04658 [Spizellomyces punctatus DAOM BR117]KND00336.1 hypothetical protein SPPG_04658 [Spizellomyces punctatus DAOM BR117]|eukprot:XP_016608375.1 hypothetical protein SPPG_04658 [Spizellomyces punctatus DAOM BR117]